MFELFKTWSKQELIRLLHQLFDIHGAQHEDGETDEISVDGLSGLLADDQHVLDAEVKLVFATIVCFEDLVVCNEDNVVYN